MTETSHMLWLISTNATVWSSTSQFMSLHPPVNATTRQTASRFVCGMRTMTSNPALNKGSNVKAMTSWVRPSSKSVLWAARWTFGTTWVSFCGKEERRFVENYRQMRGTASCTEMNRKRIGYLRCLSLVGWAHVRELRGFVCLTSIWQTREPISLLCQEPSGCT